MTEWRRREKRGQPSLERAHPAKKRRLQPWSAASRFRDSKEQTAIRVRITERCYHAVVAVQLDGEAQTTQLPPEGEVPRHQDQRERCEQQQVRIVCAPVLFLVAQDISSLHTWEREHPLRYQNARAQQSHGSRAERIGNYDWNAIDDCRHPARALALA